MLKLPRFVLAKELAGGKTGFYWTVPTYYKKQGCPFENVPLGFELGAAFAQAKAWNDRFDEWRSDIENGTSDRMAIRVGTVKWLFHTYQHSDAYTKKVSARSALDYRKVLNFVGELPTKDPARPTVNDLLVRSIDPAAVDKLYNMFIDGDKFRRGEKAVIICRRAWKVVRRLFPAEFRADVPNPWEGLTMVTRTQATKAATDRDSVYRFAWHAIGKGLPEFAAAAILCFEFLQRPENVTAGGIPWGDYRGRQFPKAIRIEHHKTGEMVPHPLDDPEDGTAFYADAEKVLAAMPRRGTVMILDDKGRVYKRNRFLRTLRRLADEIELPVTFTLDACRHGGMTELEEAELTEGQGMALSGHRTPRAYRVYAKLTEKRILGATRKRVAGRDSEPEANSA
jgi:hypothetical protein